MIKFVHINLHGEMLLKNREVIEFAASAGYHPQRNDSANHHHPDAIHDHDHVDDVLLESAY